MAKCSNHNFYHKAKKVFFEIKFCISQKWRRRKFLRDKFVIFKFLGVKSQEFQSIHFWNKTEKILRLKFKLESFRLSSIFIKSHLMKILIIFSSYRNPSTSVPGVRHFFQIGILFKFNIVQNLYFAIFLRGPSLGIKTCLQFFKAFFQKAEI